MLAKDFISAAEYISVFLTRSIPSDSSANPARRLSIIAVAGLSLRSPSTIEALRQDSMISSRDLEALSTLRISTPFLIILARLCDA